MTAETLLSLLGQIAYSIMGASFLVASSIFYVKWKATGVVAFSWATAATMLLALREFGLAVIATIPQNVLSDVERLTVIAIQRTVATTAMVVLVISLFLYIHDMLKERRK